MAEYPNEHEMEFKRTLNVVKTSVKIKGVSCVHERCLECINVVMNKQMASDRKK